MKKPVISRNTALWVAAGTLLYGLFLLFYLPATTLADLVAKTTHDQIRIANSSGSAWNGRGQLMLQQPGRAPISLGGFAWDLRLPYLLLAKLRIDARLTDGPIAGDVSIQRTMGSLVLRSVKVKTDATQLAKLHPALNLANLRGEMILDASRIQFSHDGITGDTTLTWTGAGSDNFNLGNLGDYRLRVSGDTNPLRLELSTLKGDVVITGEGIWDTTKDGKLKLDIVLQTRGRQETIDPLLQSWASPLGQGRYRYTLDTTVHLPKLL